MKRILGSIVVVVLLGSAWVFPVQALNATVICLDAGHGGVDPGAVFQFSDGTVLNEADINLDVAQALKTLLERKGYQVVMARTDDTALSTRERYPVANSAGAMMFISIHTNSIGPDIAGQTDGTLTLYRKDIDKPLAEVLDSALYAALAPSAPNRTIFLDRGARTFRSRMMSRTTMPAVIVEPVFLSLPGEATRLADPIQRGSAGSILSGTRRAEIANALYDGILTYLALPPQPTPTPAPTRPAIPYLLMGPGLLRISPEDGVWNLFP